ncbi:hypothetical protein A3F00_02850 [Candidatus Daviesbacteria bacterium RIFCSPHIGHO2_12_FULL_37_11]|uniref:Uncharacterized protein n=1 Tax=Candidatus Daviesbacteria bacterium RIFCSPHIGHO2_12_FULL_37_11 TaxID=1797777 RepID=A0A1F5K903_9BACT|nr:MAG: hypothetical protein A3F00_02850 [Candidatus Daviesbacteria bacterium RIFCSPHIGHO2_12_FULL_37_11]OGE45556.1 MAG: hypothetical protein A3B39_05090 [Candidatus Daviesbacteria bacterium RIFCSPLOWO2_01_FULL_37_10]
MLELTEPINVWVFFKGGTLQPHTFFWKQRQIKVEKINLVHTTKNGQNLIFHFSVSSGGNFYKLAFDLESLKWFLEAVEEG